MDPFKHGYALKMLKNTIVENISLPGDYSRFNGVSGNFDKELKEEREMERKRQMMKIEQ